MGIRSRRTLGATLACSLASVLAIIPLMSAENPSQLTPTQNLSRPPLEPFVSPAAAFAVSAPASDLPAAAPDVRLAATFEASQDWELGRERAALRNEFTRDLSSIDGALQSAIPESDIPAAALSFDGINNQDNLAIAGLQPPPPDTNGDVGPNHYVQATNVLFRIWDKNGVPLTSALRLSSLFAPLGGACALTPAKGDPIVLYDPLADRWLLSQLGFITSPASPPFFECIAISQTPDPTGPYYLYAFQVPNNEFPDYPKLGVWPDGYYMTVNQFTAPQGTQNGTGAYAFDRARMLEGDPSASFIYFNLNRTVHPDGIVGMLPSDFDGLTPPPPGRPNTFAYFISIEFGDPVDGLRLFDFHADFKDPARSTFTERLESPLAVASFDPTSPIGRRDIRQPPLPPPFDNNTNTLDSISDRLMFRLQYRNAGGAETLVANHTVGAPASTVIGTYTAGVRYYQLSSRGGPFEVAEHATYAPNDGLSRWMGSAATDNQGNLAVGFSTSSASSFPSVRYAGRLASDPPGGLFQGESVLVAGTGVQTSTSNRWGDYSALVVDPSDDCTFWYTNEYYTAASQAASAVGWITRVGRFKFPECTPPSQGTLRGVITDAGSGNPIAGALVQVSNGFSQTSGANGAYSRALASGVYDVTVSRLGFEPATVAGVVIRNGAVATLNVELTGAAVIEPGSAAITTERFSPANNAIDAGEIVTVDLTLRNIGPGDSRNLTATLEATGGVLDPSGSQRYGVIPALGGAATRPFTFRADPALGCGGTLTATVRLSAGSIDLGSVTFKFLLAGAPRTVLAENFDNLTAPNLPQGWTALNLDASPVLWATTATSSDTPPFNAAVSVPPVVSDKVLESPAFQVQTAGAQLSFRHLNIFETGNDGGVLEISLDKGPFMDILNAGGRFLQNGYTHTISTLSGNPIGGRLAWSGASGGYRTTEVALPPAAAGRMVKLRWRMGSNSSVAAVGSIWRVDTITVTEVVADCAFNFSGVTALKTESFSPPNGAIDAGETVSVDFSLVNFGLSATANLVASLEPTGGVLDPGPPQHYGAVFRTPVTRSFTFRADPLLGCGGALTATLRLQDGSTDLGSISFKILLAGSVITDFSENFDGVTPPALPPLWIATSLEASPVLWSTTPAFPDTPPNTAIVTSSTTVSDRRLDSPFFTVRGAAAQLRFRSMYILQPGFDGGVLEISVNGGPFVDILEAGGSFVENGYNSTISTATSSPIAGRQAWSGSATAFVTTRVNLPPAAAGKTVQLRWRLASDNAISLGGWRVDTISVTEVLPACTFNILPAGFAVTAESFSPPNGAIDPGENVTVDFTLRNNGTQSTSDLVARLASGGGVIRPGRPQTYGALAGNGGTGAKSFAFRADPALPCGSTLTATLHLQDGSTDLGAAAFKIPLAGSVATVFAEDFDSVIPPALPPGWTATSLEASPVLWSTTPTLPDTPPNEVAITAGSPVVSDRRLDSPAIAVKSASAQLRFRHFHILQDGFDGGVLEISLDGGPFVDILEAGGSFVEYGYNFTISSDASGTPPLPSPLAGRRAWSGNTGGYVTTRVNLPATAAGKMARIRWRLGSDNTIASPGWRVDTITITDIPVACVVREGE